MSTLKFRVTRLEAKRPDPERPYIGGIPWVEGMTEAEYRIADERARAQGPLTEEEWARMFGAEICGKPTS